MVFCRSIALMACVTSVSVFAQQPYGVPPPPPQTYAQIVSKTPVYRQVQVAIPRQECQTVQVQQNQQGNTDTAVGAVLGGVLGGVLGHQVGHGNGKDVATAIGAVAGAAAGADVGHNAAGPAQTQTVQQCRQVMDYSTQQQPDGFDVAYRYADVVYHTHTAYDPGNAIPVRVSVTPILGPN